MDRIERLAANLPKTVGRVEYCLVPHCPSPLGGLRRGKRTPPIRRSLDAFFPVTGSCCAACYTYLHKRRGRKGKPSSRRYAPVLRCQMPGCKDPDGGAIKAERTKPARYTVQTPGGRRVSCHQCFGRYRYAYQKRRGQIVKSNRVLYTKSAEYRAECDRRAAELFAEKAGKGEV